MFILFILVGCSTAGVDLSKAQVSKCKDVQEKIDKDLKNWKFVFNLDVDCDHDTLGLRLIYLKGSPIYLDEYSNELVVRTLVHKYQDELSAWKVVNMTLEFDGFSDSGTFMLDYQKRGVISDYFSNKQFFNDVIFTLSEFSTKEITDLDITLESFYQVNPEPPKKNYWELFKGFQEFCTTHSKDNFVDALVYIFLVQHTKYGDSQNVYNESFHERFYPFLDKYGIDRSIIDIELMSETSDFLKKYLK